MGIYMGGKPAKMSARRTTPNSCVSAREGGGRSVGLGTADIITSPGRVEGRLL